MSHDNRDDQELDKELQVRTSLMTAPCNRVCLPWRQRLIGLQRVAIELEQQAGLLAPSAEALEEYAGPDNWQACANDLNSALAGEKPVLRSIAKFKHQWICTCNHYCNAEANRWLFCSVWLS